VIPAHPPHFLRYGKPDPAASSIFALGCDDRSLAELAAILEGKALLITGDVENNVHHAGVRAWRRAGCSRSPIRYCLRAVAKRGN
jgi:hypothetical protein